MKIARYLALLFLLNCVPARAYEVEIGSVLVCDTQKQVERFVQIFDQNLEAAISRQHRREQPDCLRHGRYCLRAGPPAGNGQKHVAHVQDHPGRGSRHEYPKRLPAR